MSTEPKVLEFATREEWLEARRTLITASDFAAVLGFDPYRTAAEVFAEKRGIIDPAPENKFTKAGNRLEPVIIDWYREETGFAVTAHKHRLEVHPDFPFLAASPDATAFTRYNDMRNVETKNTGYYPGQKWGAEGTDEVPERNLVQAQGQMFIRGLLITDMPVLIAGNDFRIYTIARSDDFVELMVDKLAAFHEQLVAGVLPDVDYSHSSALELVQRMYRSVDQRTVELSAEYLDVARQLQAARVAKSRADKVEREMKARIFAAMGEAAIAHIEGAGEIAIERKAIKKNFQPKPAETRTEIHLKVRGLGEEEDAA